MPVQRQGVIDADHGVDAEDNDPLRAGKTFCMCVIPKYLGSAGHLQRGARIEIDKQQPAMRIGLDIAQGVEHPVAGIVGKQKLF